MKIKDSTVAREFNDPLYREVRREFMAGRWPSNRGRCRRLAGGQPGKSKKASERPVFELYRDLIAKTAADGSVGHFPKQIDIRLGTICNLKCIHCGTGNSSKWNEDAALLGKYPNTEIIRHDNSWVDRDGELWENICERIAEIDKFNFLGGEPFASRQHKRLIERVADSGHAQRIMLHYVTNGTLLTPAMIATLKKFKQVTLNVSLDAAGKALEFFRFPIVARELDEKLSWLDAEATAHFNPAIQWTSSNVSLYYLDQTLDHLAGRFPNLELKFCNFVDFPAHMSPQNLPLKIKERIARKLEFHSSRHKEIPFFLDHMFAADLWPAQGPTFIRYLDDLSAARGLRWEEHFPELYGELHARH